MDRRWPCMSSWSHPSRYYSSNKLRQTIARTIATHLTWKSRHLFTLHQCHSATSTRAHLLRTSSGAGAAAPSAASAVKSTPNRPENILQYINNRGDQNLATNGLLQCTHTQPLSNCTFDPPFIPHPILPTAIPHQGPQGEKSKKRGKSDNNIHPNSTITIADEASHAIRHRVSSSASFVPGRRLSVAQLELPVWPQLHPERKPGGD